MAWLRNVPPVELNSGGYDAHYHSGNTRANRFGLHRPVFLVFWRMFCNMRIDQADLKLLSENIGAVESLFYFEESGVS